MRPPKIEATLRIGHLDRMRQPWSRSEAPIACTYPGGCREPATRVLLQIWTGAKAHGDHPVPAAATLLCPKHIAEWERASGGPSGDME